MSDQPMTDREQLDAQDNRLVERRAEWARIRKLAADIARRSVVKFPCADINAGRATDLTNQPCSACGHYPPHWPHACSFCRIERRIEELKPRGEEEPTKASGSQL